MRASNAQNQLGRFPMNHINRFLILLVMLVMVLAPVSARANESMAIGVQGGFLATGAVIDIPFGPLSVNAGVNYPVGWLYIKTLASEDASVSGLIDPFFVVTADVTAPISMGESFDLKIGVSTLGFTNFATGLFGVAGAALKGEYWIPEKEMGLFVNLNVPVMLYVVGEDTPFSAIFSPWLPLAGLFTTTAGVLWKF